MIPREILKKIRQIEIRTNRIEPSSAGAHPRIPTGFQPKAQGCEEPATLGDHPQYISNRKAVASVPFVATVWEIYHNTVGVDFDWNSFCRCRERFVRQMSICLP